MQPTQNDPALQEDVQVSSDRLLDPDQQQKRLDFIRNRVNSIAKVPHKKELEEELLQCHEKGTEVNAPTAELYREQRHTDLTELVVILQTTQYEICGE